MPSLTSFYNLLPPPGNPSSPRTSNLPNYSTFAMSHSSPWPKYLRLCENSIVRFHKCAKTTQTKKRHLSQGKQHLSKVILKLGSSQVSGLRALFLEISFVFHTFSQKLSLINSISVLKSKLVFHYHESIKIYTCQKQNKFYSSRI
jgi:hypothetical protein